MFSLLHFFVAKYQDYTALLILEVSAVFNTINYLILLDRLKEWFGLGGDVLEWLGQLLQTLFQSVQI